MVTEKQIQEITNIIVDTVNPRKIYLFGSYANGNATEESDLDFLIIVKDEGKKKYEVIQKIYSKLWNTARVPKDIIVQFEDYYKTYHKVPYSFVGYIVSTGKLLYAN